MMANSSDSKRLRGIDFKWMDIRDSRVTFVTKKVDYYNIVRSGLILVKVHPIFTL